MMNAPTDGTRDPPAAGISNTAPRTLCAWAQTLKAKPNPSKASRTMARILRRRVRGLLGLLYRLIERRKHEAGPDSKTRVASCRRVRSARAPERGLAQAWRSIREGLRRHERGG